MSARMLRVPMLGLLVIAFANPLPAEAAKAKLSREDAMQKCNDLVSKKRGMSSGEDMQRSSAWKACMTKLGFQP